MGVYGCVLVSMGVCCVFACVKLGLVCLCGGYVGVGVGVGLSGVVGSRWVEGKGVCFFNALSGVSGAR